MTVEAALIPGLFGCFLDGSVVVMLMIGRDRQRGWRPGQPDYIERDTQPFAFYSSIVMTLLMSLFPWSMCLYALGLIPDPWPWIDRIDAMLSFKSS